MASVVRRVWSKRRLASALTLLAVVASGWAGLGGTNAAAKATTLKPHRGGTLNFLFQVDASGGYDPAKTTQATALAVDSTIFNTLIDQTPQGELTPELAASWTISPNGRLYTFHIRPGVKFSNGDPLTASDVVFTIDRLQNPATGSPEASAYQGLTASAPNSSTVVLKLKSPFSPLLDYLANVSASIVWPTGVTAPGGMADHPVGTGPFELQSWTPNQELTVVRNPYYWQPGLPWLNKIVFTFTSSPTMRITELQDATVDFLYGAPYASFAVLKAAPALAVYGGGGPEAFDYLWLNSSLAPLQSPLVRQAIYWALNRSVIARAGGPPGIASPLNSGFLPSDSWVGASKPIYHQDYAKAKRLLAEADYPQGISFTINVPGDASPFQVTTAEVIQEELAPAGIHATLNLLNAPQLLAAESTHKFQAQVLGQPETVNPFETFQEYFLPGGGQNDTDFHDAHVDRLMTEALASTSLANQGGLYRAAEERLAEVGPMAFLFSWNNIDVAQNFVRGYVYNPYQISYSSLEDVWLAPHAGS